MPRDIPISNGSMLVTFDHDYVMRDFFFPQVGGENHTIGHPCRFGVWVDGQFSWMGPEWRRDLRYDASTLVTQVTARHDRLQVELRCRDTVDFHLNVYIKEIVVKNLTDRPRDVRLFFHHDLHISGNEVGDTVNFDPPSQALVHYKGKRYFLMGCADQAKYGIDHFACGVKESQNMEGTWRDAEDGELSGHAIAHGSVDSTFRISLQVPPGGQAMAYYWVCAGTCYGDVTKINQDVRQKTPQALFKRTGNYWNLWVSKEFYPGDGELPPKVLWLLRQSLLVVRTQIDNGGAIIAANDTDILSFARDTYSYMWPRDGAFVAVALIKAGYAEVARRFFFLCHQIITPYGYFLHKYGPDGSVGSSWHPWWRDGKRELPIQEDETALVLWALWLFFEKFHDLEFIKPLYRGLIVRAADFLVSFRDPTTKLPLPSYDLWEERHGVHTYTVATVVAGLRAAANFTRAFGEVELAAKYRDTADEIKQAMQVHLFHRGLNRFARNAQPNPTGGYTLDMTIDASLVVIWYLGVFDTHDPLVASTMQAIRDRLWVKTDVGGVARYEADYYQQVERNDIGRVPGNPWFICTLWWAQYLIAKSQREEELQEALILLQWVADRALPSGVLAEQVNPYTNEPLSVSPLTWSHAAFVTTTLEYLEKRRMLQRFSNGGAGSDGGVSSLPHDVLAHPGGQYRGRQKSPAPHTKSS